MDPINSNQQNPVQNRSEQPLTPAVHKNSILPWIVIIIVAIAIISIIAMNVGKGDDMNDTYAPQQQVNTQPMPAGDTGVDESVEIRDDLQSSAIEGTSDAF